MIGAIIVSGLVGLIVGLVVGWHWAKADSWRRVGQ